jgi:type I restriction enzyme S subunit
LGEVFEWVRTNSLSREHLTEEPGGIQNIHYGDIHKKFKPNFRQDEEDVPYISEKSGFAPSSDDEFCKVGDVIIADASVTWYPEPACHPESRLKPHLPNAHIWASSYLHCT